MVDLEYPGIFLISASSGFTDPDHHYLKSFKVWDTSQVASKNNI
jgi:hypothetical protein